MSEEFRCGFVGIVGPTNSGKSTLTNALVGQKVSITSHLPQTTYHGIRGIVNGPNWQAVLTDTPGFQKHPDTIPRMLNKVADRNAKECEILVWVFDASSDRMLGQIHKLKNKISQFKTPENSLCALNKVDKIPKGKLLPILQELHELNIFSEIVPISALKTDGTDRLLSLVVKRLPVGPAMYPTDARTDRPIDFQMSELIREKIYRTTREEIPYSARVEIEQWEDEESEKAKCPTIRAIIHVDSDSRKAILIGKMGAQLKEIGTKARHDIEDLVGHQVCLKLYVSLDKEWRKDSNHLTRYLELV